MEGMQEIEEYLYALKRKGPKLGLERMQALLEALGNPQDAFGSVLIGGTNGKGSTSAIMESILRSAGYRTGLYTSPHLQVLNERIAIDNRQISDDELMGICIEIKGVIEKRQKMDRSFEAPTFFELITAAAFLHFKKKGVDMAVVEVGLGGRLDATNTLAPLVSIITNISLEHTEILGDAIAKIAAEKAGIIKDGGFLITGSQDKEALDVFRKVCGERDSRMMRVGKEITVKRKPLDGGLPKQQFSVTIPDTSYDDLEMRLLGEHQLLNAGCACGAVYALRTQGITISDDALRAGLLNAIWPGRMEIVQENPMVMLDCAKDAAAARCLRIALQEMLSQKPVILVVSISADKSVDKMLEEVVPIADTVIATAHNVMGRAAAPEDLARMISRLGKPVIIIRDVKEAVAKARDLAGLRGAVIVTGSVFTVGEAREMWFKPKSGSGRFGRDLNETPRK